MGGEKEDGLKPVEDTKVVELQRELPSQLSAGDNEKSPGRDSVSGSTVNSGPTKGKSVAQTTVTDDSEDPFAHLPDHEREILKKQLDVSDLKVSFIGLHRYASKTDLLIIFVSAICAIAAGAALPLFTVSEKKKNFPSTV